jgi:aquaporin Z
MKKYVMEFVGTLLFVFSIMGIVASGTPLAGLAIGLALTMVVYLCAPVSGGHVNPAVTLGLYLRKKIGGRDAIWYIVAQIL